MNEDFIMPDIGEGIVECELVEWLVEEGEVVAEDQPVADVQTDKALVQIPAKHSGRIVKKYVPQGEIAKVHSPLYQIEISGQIEVNGRSSDSISAPATVPESANTGNMQEDFIMPDIGEGIVECELVEWLVEEGEVVAEDQPVADVQTDKALVQIPAKHAGKIVKRYVEQGDIAKVHAPLYRIEIQIELNESEGLTLGRSAPDVATAQQPSKVVNIQQNIAPSELAHRKVLATPAVRRIAREKSINIADVLGTGPKGRVLKSDMLAFSTSSSQSKTASSSNVVSNSVALTSSKSVKGHVEVIPMKGIRAAMAKQMMKSVSTIPHFTYAEEVDITKSNKLRRVLNSGLAEDETKLTLMAVLVKSLSLALNAFPILNSHMNEAGTEIHQHAEHNIGMAVDSPMGLLVPNIKNVERLSLVEIATEIKRLATAGRAGRLSPADMSGGTITISNIGAIGGTVTTPIVNAPEVAIVGIGRIQQLPRPNAKGKLKIREIIQVSWSGDHRVIDGGTIARFNNCWKDYLEYPQRMMLKLK